MRIENRFRVFGVGILASFLLSTFDAGAQGRRTLPVPSDRVVELDATRWTALKRERSGAPSVVVVWYAGCKPVELVPAFLERLQRRYGGPFSVTFVSTDDVEAVPAAAERLGLPMPWFTAPFASVVGDRAQELFQGVTLAPAFVFFDEAGRRQAMLNGIEAFGEWTLHTEYVRNGQPVEGSLDGRGEQLAAALWESHVSTRTPTERLVKLFRLEAADLRASDTVDLRNGVPLNRIAGMIENDTLGIRIPVTVTGQADLNTHRVALGELEATGAAVPLRSPR